MSTFNQINRELLQTLDELHRQLNAFHGFRHLWAELIANREPCGVPVKKLEQQQLDRLNAALGQAYVIAQKLGIQWTKCEVSYEETMRRFKGDKKDREDKLRDLLHHAYIHSNYDDLGFKQMTTDQKRLLVSVLRESDMTECANRLEKGISD